MPGYTFRHDVPEVRLQFTAADEQGRLINNLSPDSVRVFDDQTLVPRFEEFERDDKLPLHLGLVVDTSDSVRRVLAQEKAAATNFLDRVMRPESDTAFVMAFGGEFKVWQSPTADRPQLRDAILRMKEPGWGTRIYDALYSACAGPLGHDDDGKIAHRALIVLSDGDDTDSLRRLSDVVTLAQRGEIQIYSLTIHPRNLSERGDRTLQRMAEATGGRSYIVQSGGDLDAAFAQIEQDLREQYYVSFTPQQGKPGFHSLRVEVRAPENVEVHARQGYFASAE